MKQGSTDDPFADDAETNRDTETKPADEEGAARSEAEETDRSEAAAAETAADSASSREATATEASTDESTDSGVDSGSVGKSAGRSLPYIYKRDAVKEGRSQRPVYLREYNEERIVQLVDDVEELLATEVTKTDVLEAAMETAIENPELVVETLKTERYGYDWE
ncbi:hypothetical protein [Halorientalis halophila]|uniref:hypothetical protein n=1 Tax=Halorientalis halophila TaxID=3108499 RepID=UPI00300B3D54